MNKFFSLSLVLALSVAPCFGVQQAAVKSQEVKAVVPTAELAPVAEEKKEEEAASKVDVLAQDVQAEQVTEVATPVEEVTK
jgi:hypothetical protein